MRIFIFRFLAFSLIFISFVSILYVFSDLYLKNRMKYFLGISNNITIVFAGDSNVECDINDHEIPNSINIAQSGEAYMYSYFKLKSMLKFNKQIKVVYLSFSFHTLDKETDQIRLFDDEVLIEKNKFYNYLLETPERELLFTKNPKSYLLGIRDFTVENLKTIGKSYSSGKMINFGGYKYLDRNKLQENIKINNSRPNVPFHFQRGEYQIDYLNRISALCHQNNIKLILINTPKHKSYTESIKPHIKFYKQIFKNVLEKDSLLDFSQMSFSDSCFADVSHLNYKGASIFSKFLKTKIHPN